MRAAILPLEGGRIGKCSSRHRGSKRSGGAGNGQLSSRGGGTLPTEAMCGAPKRGLHSETAKSAVWARMLKLGAVGTLMQLQRFNGAVVFGNLTTWGEKVVRPHRAAAWANGQ